ncbi:MAG: type I 3-dehydroquinate dehydratase [Thaumarchaeota archaeon]|nr:type I 3-dehydroquinate dehydratase [Nitrososphaerota archaeon]
MKGEMALQGKVGGRLGKVCTTVSAKTSDEMGRKAATAFALGTDLVEFRVDLMKRPEAGAFGDLRRFARKSIFTVRRSEEGGGLEGSEAERLDLISEIGRFRPLYLDVELSTALENPDWYSGLPKSSKKIVSWHDFSGTPALSVMKRTRDQASAIGDIAKLVTTARKKDDNARVLKLYEESPGDLIAFCMGAVGTPSRLASLQRGSPIVYASLPNEPVAPGQLSVSTVVALKRSWERR